MIREKINFYFYFESYNKVINTLHYEKKRRCHKRILFEYQVKEKPMVLTNKRMK